MKHLRVIAPSESWKPAKELIYRRAEERLKARGWSISYGRHVKNITYLGSASAKQRADDLHAAYSDGHVDAVIALHGGFLENEVLPHIDWEVIRQNAKPFIGYSDNTILLNAIYAKTGHVGMLGPNLGTLGYENGWEYCLDNLLHIIETSPPHELTKSTKWHEGETIHKTADWQCVQPGVAEGRLIGGNAGSLYLLQGTEYMPGVQEPFILAFEADELAKEYTAHEFVRSLESLLQLPGARESLHGLLVGRFEPASDIDIDAMHEILRAKLPGIPIITGIDFGHTVPMLSLPIGGTISIDAAKSAGITILTT